MDEEREDTQTAAASGEQEVREQTTEMAREGDKMENRLEELGDDIKDAKRTAAQRQDAPDATPGESADDPVGQTAGDWEGESVGADQGDDATDDVDGEETKKD